MHSSNHRRWYLLTVAAVLLALQLSASLCAAQGDTTICVKAIARADTTTNSVTISATWHPCLKGVEMPDNMLKPYYITLYSADDPTERDSAKVEPKDSTTGALKQEFTGREFDKEYCIRVIGYDKSVNSHVVDTCGLLEAKSDENGEGFFTQFLTAYKKSTIFGKAAFIVIGIFLFFGIFLFWFFKAWSAFRAENVFVKARKEYLNLKALRDKSQKRFDELVAQKDSTLGNTEVEDYTPEQKYFQAKLLDATRVLTAYNTALEICRMDGHLVEDVDLFRNPLFKFLSKVADKVLWVVSFRWILLFMKRKPTLDFHEVPTLKIIQSALDASKNGKDIHNALDVRVASEISKLRERGFIDAIWGLGVTAPLLGLFGTITGLTMAFRRVEIVSGTNPSEILKELGGGIYEALWTTFFGLLTGIVLMLVYYYYNYKLERITALWEDMSANLMDLLKNHHSGATK